MELAKKYIFLPLKMTQVGEVIKYNPHILKSNVLRERINHVMNIGMVAAYYQDKLRDETII